jgi:hypothetical protein
MLPKSLMFFLFLPLTDATLTITFSPDSNAARFRLG